MPQQILGIDYFRGFKAHVEIKRQEAIFPMVPATTQSHPHIRYHSCFAVGRPGLLPTFFALAPAYHYIRAVTGQENDGVVTLDSGNFQLDHCAA